MVGAGVTGGGGGGTVVGARVTGGGGGTTVVGTGGVTRGEGGGVVGVVVVGAGLVTGPGRPGAVVVGEAAPFTWPAGTPLVVAAREPEVSANAALVLPAATRAIKAKMIPRRLVMRGSFDSGGWFREPASDGCPFGISELSYAKRRRRVHFYEIRSPQPRDQTVEHVGS